MFYLRSPVLVVTDNSFSVVYGVLRFTLRDVMTSLELFRRVIPVRVSESAGSDLVDLAVEEASPSPLAVLFPYRYLEGARNYREKYPGIPALVMMGREPKIQAPDADLSFVYTDIVQELYRAGLCAAALTGENKRILFFSDRALSSEYRNAFQEGLRNQGFLDNPVYASVSTDYSSYSDIGCVIVAGAASKFLERNLKIPIILFSWADPALTPRTVKLVFDDSPLVVAADVIKALSLQEVPGEILASSDPVILPARIEDKNDFRKIQALIKENFQKK